MHLARKDAHTLHGAVGSFLPAFQLLGALVYHHILVFHRLVYRLHVYREHPAAVTYRRHLQITLRIPVAQCRMVAQRASASPLYRWGSTTLNITVLSYNGRKGCCIFSQPLA